MKLDEGLNVRDYVVPFPRYRMDSTVIAINANSGSPIRFATRFPSCEVNPLV